MSDDVDEVGTELRRAVTRLCSRFRSERLEGEVPDAAPLVLLVLDAGDRMSLTDLAEHAKVALGSMSRTVRRLETPAYVTRTEDRREVVLTLTEVGRAAVTTSRRHRRGGCARAGRTRRPVPLLPRPSRTVRGPRPMPGHGPHRTAPHRLPPLRARRRDPSRCGDRPGDAAAGPRRARPRRRHADRHPHVRLTARRGCSTTRRGGALTAAVLRDDVLPDRRRTPRRGRASLLAAAAVLLCGAVAVTAVPALAAPAKAPAGLAQRRFAAMTPAERVGQLLMVGCPSTAATKSCLQIIRAQHVGSVILDGNSTLSIAATHRVTAALQKAAPATSKLLIATDQEGGEVRRLRGPGFTDYSTALVQGTWRTADLQHWATTWGSQLKRAGIGLDLAPVLDTVRKGNTHNPPIGAFDREYGHTPSVVATKGVAVVKGLTAGGVSTAVKHFPGLGRVTANTDTTAHVTDTTTTAKDAYLAPFRAAIGAKTAFVMMSSATYTRIDAKNPAAFSKTVVTGLLRKQLKFTGLVISDDLGQAKQVASVPVGQRATRFIAAGGDVVLTVEPSQAKTMEAAVLKRMRSSTAFTKQVNAAALLVLQQKQKQGLLH